MFAYKKMFVRCLASILLLVAGAQVHAADLRSISVVLEDEHYFLKSEAWLDAPKSVIYEILADYDLFVQISSGFVESRNVPAEENGTPGFYTRMRGCVLVFCKSFERLGSLRLEPKYYIVAMSDPEQSDFDYSRESWELFDDEGGTLMIYHFEMDPSFWVPPVIGPFYIKRTLKRGGEDAITRIEALAQGRTPDE